MMGHILELVIEVMEWAVIYSGFVSNIGSCYNTALSVEVHKLKLVIVYVFYQANESQLSGFTQGSDHVFKV